MMRRMSTILVVLAVLFGICAGTGHGGEPMDDTKVFWDAEISTRLYRKGRPIGVDLPLVDIHT